MSIKSPYMEQRELRFSTDELQKLKVFKDNNPLLKLLRKVFWQRELTEDEVELIKDSITPEVVVILRRIINPSLDHNEPIFEMGSRWIDRKYSDLLSEEAKPLVLARKDDINFQENGLKRLENILTGKDEPLTLDIDLNMEKDYSDLPAGEVKRAVVAVQDSLSFFESRLLEIKTLSQMEEETPEEREERIKKDSTK